MYIRKVMVQAFKALRSVKIELNEDLNIIVGDNAEGKL